MSEAIYTLALGAINRQRADYRTLRAEYPEQFGPFDGAMDGTPELGPMPLPIFWEAAGDWHWRVLWGIHKHSWALDYSYCLGIASDSRGERTSPQLMFDVRDMPSRYIGRFAINKAPICGRKPHRTIIGRALADSFDLASISAEQAHA